MELGIIFLFGMLVYCLLFIMVIYLLACAVRFLYILLIKRRIACFTNLPIMVGMFLILIPMLFPFFWHQVRQEYPLPPYFPGALDFRSMYKSDEEVTSSAWITSVAAALIAAFFVGLPVDLIRNLIKRKKQASISVTP